MWEILELKIHTETSNKKHCAVQDEYYKRIRLVIEDHALMGTFISRNPISNERIVEKALESLKPITDFNPTNLKFSKEKYEKPEVNLGSKRSKYPFFEQIDVNLQTSIGGNISYSYFNIIEKKSELTCKGIMNLVKGLNISLNKHSKTWLFTPYALSKIFLNYFIDVLKGEKKNYIIPDNIDIIDRGLQMFDLEGFKKTKTEFIKNGALITSPVDLITSLKINKNQTGHGGISGISVKDIYINSEYYPAFETTKSVLIVEDAHVINFSDNVFHVILKPYRSQPFIAKFNFDKNFFLQGRWVYKVEKGLRPWESPWFLSESNDLIEIVT